MEHDHFNKLNTVSTVGLIWKVEIGQVVSEKKLFNNKRMVETKECSLKMRSCGRVMLVKYFKRYAMDKLIIAKIKTGSNSVSTCNRVTVLALCTISDGILSVYQVSFDFLLYFQWYAPDKFNIAKIRKGNNSINMIGLWLLHSGLLLIALYHCIKFHLFIANTFRDMLRTSLLLQKLGREKTL